MRRNEAAVRLAVLALILGAAFVAAWKTGLFQYTDLSTAASAVREFRDVPFIVPLFVLAYALATTFGLPGSILTLAGGAMFGFGLGFLLNWIGATIGAFGAYGLARTVGKKAFRGILGRHGEQLHALAESRGFLPLLRLRLIPIVPFNVLNIASGLAGVPARSYIAATALGIIPGTAIYTYFADALLVGAEGAQEKALARLAIAGGLLVLLSFVPAIARKFGMGTMRAAVILALALTPARRHAEKSFPSSGEFDSRKTDYDLSLSSRKRARRLATDDSQSLKPISAAFARFRLMSPARSRGGRTCCLITASGSFSGFSSSGLSFFTGMRGLERSLVLSRSDDRTSREGCSPKITRAFGGRRLIAVGQSIGSGWRPGGTSFSQMRHIPGGGRYWLGTGSFACATSSGARTQNPETTMAAKSFNVLSVGLRWRWPRFTV